MHGTPVSSANLYPTNARDGRYDAPLLRQITPPSHQGSPLIKETGSITQGKQEDFDVDDDSVLNLVFNQTTSLFKIYKFSKL